MGTAGPRHHCRQSRGFDSHPRGAHVALSRPAHGVQGPEDLRVRSFAAPRRRRQAAPLRTGRRAHDVTSLEALDQLVDDLFEQYVVRGTTNIDAPSPVTETTLFQTGSTTKTYVAVAVLRLVEEGLADLDAP